MTASTAYARQPEVRVVASSGYAWAEKPEITIAEYEAIPEVARQGVKITYKRAPLSPGSVRVGDGVTMGVGSDSYAGTVFEVSPSGKTFKFTLDKARRTDSNGMSEDQTWSYETVEPWSRTDEYGIAQSNVEVARWSEKRKRFQVGKYSGVYRGRRQHMDPHF